MPPGRQLTKVCTARHDPQPPLLVPSATCVKGLGFFSSSAVSWQFEITALVGSAERTGTGTRVPSARDATHALEMASVYGPLCFQPGLDSGEKAHGECDRSRREVGRPLGGNARPRPRPPPSLELYRGWRSSRALRMPALRPVSPALKRPQQCRAGHLVHARGRIPHRERVERGRHGHAQDGRLRRRVLHVERPGVTTSSRPSWAPSTRRVPPAGDVVVASLFQSGTSTWAEIHDLTAGVHRFADSPTTRATPSSTSAPSTRFPRALRSQPSRRCSRTPPATGLPGLRRPDPGQRIERGDRLMKAGALVTSRTGSRFSVKFKHAT